MILNPAVNYCTLDYEGLSFVLDCILFPGRIAETVLEHVKSRFNNLSYMTLHLILC